MVSKFKIVACWVTPDVRRKIDDKLAGTGKSKSDYLRELIMQDLGGVTPMPVLNEDDKAVNDFCEANSH